MRRAREALFALFLMGCADPLPVLSTTGAPLQDVALRVGAGEEQVHLTLAGAWIDGEGAEGHGDDATATIEGAPPLIVHGDRSSWNLRDGVVVFEGAVEATRGEVTLRCARLEVVYAGDRIARADAIGAVSVSHGARTAHAERAALTVADGRIVLTGSATIQDGPNRMVGEPITLFLDDERIECDRCRLVVDGAAVAPGAR